jgi:pilus assembly protein Flp/PilA
MGKPSKSADAKFTDGKLLGRFLRDESGASAIEYALIASGVSIVIAGSVMTAGTTVKNLYVSVANALK